MKVEAERAAVAPSIFARSAAIYREITGQSLPAWGAMALLNLATQVVLFRAMVGSTSTGRTTGEFGTFNAALAIIGLLTVPLATLALVLRLPGFGTPSAALRKLRASPGVAMETSAWLLGAAGFALIFLPWPGLALPRFAVQVLSGLNLLLVLGALVAGAPRGASKSWQTLSGLVIAAGAIRLLAAGWFTGSQPCAEAALAAYIAGGVIAFLPVLRPQQVTWGERFEVLRLVADRDFRREGLAALSVMLSIFLFTNADRIAALTWLNVRVGSTEVPSAPVQHIFDIYQAAGLLARSLLWGTLPLLWLLYAERVGLRKTTAASLRFFWVYLVVLFLGAAVLVVLGHRGGVVEQIIPQAGDLIPTFAVVMLPLGLLQGLAVFSLASGRRPECHALGICSVIYALILAAVGRRPETMMPYMLGLSLIALMVVLFIGVVRWGRRQP